MAYRVAFIGTGDPDADGFAMAYSHANGYQQFENCEPIACADIVLENAERFAAGHDIHEKHIYENYETMLENAEPDIVSICVPPAVHAPAAIASIRSQSVDAVHCEKPMATTWRACERMALEAERHGVQLTFNHQRRFGSEWQKAKSLLDDGAIGELRRIETAAPDLFDWGTHCVDLCGMFVDEASPEWVLGGIDAREENRIFGVNHENQGMAVWQYENGVHGLVSTGSDGETIDSGLVDCLHRLEGSDGVIEINRRWAKSHPPLQIRRAGETEWTGYEFDDEDDIGDLVSRSVAHIVTALEEGFTPMTDAKHALNATELIFGVYESARRRGRVDFPLDIDDHPLEAMIEAGDLSPKPVDD